MIETNHTVINARTVKEGRLVTFAAQGDRKETKFVELRIADNPGKGFETEFLAAKFSAPADMERALKVPVGTQLVVQGFRVNKKGKDGKIWPELLNARLVGWWPDIVSPPAPEEESAQLELPF